MSDYNEGYIVGKVRFGGSPAEEDRAYVTVQRLWSTATNRIMRLFAPRGGTIVSDNQPRAFTGGSGMFIIQFFWLPEDIADVAGPVIARLTCGPVLRQGDTIRYPETVEFNIGLYLSMRSVADGSGIPNLRDRSSLASDVGPDVYNLFRTCRADYPRYVGQLMKVPKAGITYLQPSPEYFSLLGYHEFDL